MANIHRLVSCKISETFVSLKNHILRATLQTDLIFFTIIYLTISIITTKFYSNIPMQSVVIVIQRISPLLNLWPCYSPIEKLYINFATKPLVLAYKWV